MAIRARLAAPPTPPKETWPWHTANWSSMSATALCGGDRRLEAQTYLSSGFGIRLAIEARTHGWSRMGELAEVWMPGRLKGVQVDHTFGTPFLAATQVFDVPPLARKWLALARTADAANRFVKAGTIFVTCSGAVGNATLAYAPHESVLISHDLLRVEAKNQRNRGWLYAYLHSPQARAMASSAQYGHIIKHLEISHLQALPVPTVDDATAADFSRRVDRILSLRNDAHRSAEEADAKFAQAVGSVDASEKEEGFVAQASTMRTGRRRLEASYYTPRAAAILGRFDRFDLLATVAKRVWWMNRFRRFYGEDGIPYMSADDLFRVNPPENKRILVEPDDNHRGYFVEKGWIVMACSGQIYGLNGAASLMTEYHENIFFSHDLIRIIPDTSKIRSGYLLVALTHRTHGRPLLIRAAYGTSIPHLDPGDVADFPVVRLQQSIESTIADLAEAAVQARAKADALEREIARDAQTIIARFMTQLPAVISSR